MTTKAICKKWLGDSLLNSACSIYMEIPCLSFFQMDGVKRDLVADVSAKGGKTDAYATCGWYGSGAYSYSLNLLREIVIHAKQFVLWNGEA